MSGGAPSVDSNGNLYVITGNGPFDATSTSAPNNDYGDSFLQLKPAASSLSVSSYFTPTNQADSNALDRDFGAGGAALVLNLPSGTPSHLVVGGGKDGALYVLNGDNLGGSRGCQCVPADPPQRGHLRHRRVLEQHPVSGADG